VPEAREALVTAVSVIGAIAAYTNPALAPFILIGTSLLAGGVNAILQEDMDMSPLSDAAKRGLQINTRSTQEYVRVVYGTQKIGGNDVYVNTRGHDNHHMYVVQGLCEGECEGILQDDGVDQVFLDDTIYTEFGGNVSYWFHSGTNTQSVDSTLNSAFSEWTDPLINLCYIVWKITLDRDYFNSYPRRTVILKGLKVYDFRDDTTAWSANPVLCLYDYMTNDRYGMGIDSDKIDLASWSSAANYCDLKGWELNAVFEGSRAGQDVIDSILSHFHGSMVRSNGKYVLRYLDVNYEATVMDIDDDHIVRDTSGKMQITVTQPGLFKKPDAMQVEYIDAENNYAVDKITVGDTLGVTKVLSLVGCTSRTQAGQIGTYSLERLQLDRIVSGTFAIECLKLEPFDVINLSVSALGISNELMRITEVSKGVGQTVNLTMMYEDVSLYDDDYNVSTQTIYNCTLPDPKEKPESVTNIDADTEETYDYRGRTYIRWYIDFDLPSDGVPIKEIRVWVSLDNVDFKQQFTTNASFYLDPVEEGQTYYVVLQAVSIYDVAETFETAPKISRTIVGISTNNPNSLDEVSIVVNDNAVTLYAPELSDPDIVAYECRWGSTWSGGVLLARLSSPNLYLYGVRPGEHTFFLNSLSSAGVYGSTPRSGTVTVPTPKAWGTSVTTQTCDYDGVGTHRNTKHVTYDSTDYLQAARGITEDDGGIRLHNSSDVALIRAQSFHAVRDISLDKLKVKIKRVGSPSGNLKAYIYDDSSGPNTSIGESTAKDVSNISTTAGWVQFSFSTPIDLTEDTKYYVVLDGNDLTGDYTNTINWRTDASTTWDESRWYYDSSWHEATTSCCLIRVDWLVGKYISPEYDLTTSDTYLVYIDTSVVLVGAGNTWGDIAPDPETWVDINAETSTWGGLVQSDIASQVEIQLRYGDTSGNLTSIVKKMEVLSAIVTARYFQYEIRIIDPDWSTNAKVKHFTAYWRT